MRTVKPLSAKQIERAKPKDKPYRLYDGNGLSILINPTSKIWHFTYLRPIIKKRTMMSLGTYPTVSLAAARTKRDEYLTILSQGIDLQEYLQEQARISISHANNTFKVVSDHWLSQQNYADSTLDGAKRYLRYANQFLATKPITSITSHDILTICEYVAQEHGKLMASGVKTKISQVLDFALGRRLIDINIARNVHHTHQIHQGSNNPAITDPQELRQLLLDINNATDLSFTIKQYMRLAVYVFVRPGELAAMHKDDIDWLNKQWRYTPPKTKKRGTELIVPLSNQAITIIQDCLDHHGQDYVFYSTRRGVAHIQIKHPASWLRRHGYAGRHTMHGFRASAKTILEEVLEYDPRFVEMQLGHTVKDINGTAYNRAKYIKQRTQMMQAWADYVDTLIK